MAGYNDDVVYQTEAQALNDYYNVDPLKAMAKLICEHVPIRKAELIEAILTAMRGANLKTLFERLSKIEQSAVAEAVFAPEGKFNHRQFRAKYLQTPELGRSSGFRADGHLIDLFIINRQVPADLRRELKTFIPKPKSDNVKYVDKLPASIKPDKQAEEKLPLKTRETAVAALHNLLTVLRLIDSGKVKVSGKTGRPTQATLKSLSGVLTGGDWYKDSASDLYEEIGPIQAFAWPIILQGAGLAKAEGSTLCLNNAGKKALKEKLPGVIKTAWKKWEKTKIIDEFSRIDTIKGQKSSRGRTLTLPSTRRPVINNLLRKCLPDKWISVEELNRYMHSKGLDFEVARYAWKLYIGDPQYGHLDDYGNWSLIEGRYFLAFLFEYAATLGLIDVAYTHPAGARPDYYQHWGSDGMDFLSRYDGLMYIRINSLGAYVLGLADQYAQPVIETVSVLKVLPNHEIVITDKGALSAADKLFLDKIGEMVTSSLWRISLKTLLSAAHDGTAPDEVQRFLKARSSVPIPQTVVTLLHDAQKRSTHLKYSGRAHIIECADPVLVQLITCDTNLSKTCMAAGDRFIVVLPGMENTFIKALANIGYMACHFKEQI